jgi:hypothetical protein
MIISIPLDGDVRLLYTESIDMRAIGSVVEMRRASHVEPFGTDQWTADLGPVDGPVLGPFDTRGEALRAEEDWLNKNYL